MMALQMAAKEREIDWEIREIEKRKVIRDEDFPTLFLCFRKSWRS